MREIKFRGYGKDKGQWIYGSLLDEKSVGIVAIQDEDCHVWEVDPNSVGQFTGMYDCDGHEIYEADILGNKYPSHYRFANAVVEWGVNGWLADCFTLLEWLKLHTCVVVGNIYDNSELLPELPEVKDAQA